MPVTLDTRTRVMDALDEHWENHYGPPSLRELVERTGINSTSVVKEALRNLEELKYIVISGDAKARCATPMWVVNVIDSFTERNNDSS